jgi:CheY-like chemotaxis protein
VILADYRMPELNGIEFLEQAMDIYPGARRVLLTAYADTGAAIAAINVVDLDHYLLKPWDPPEGKPLPGDGRAAGLGLDITWRIVVNKHHGDITVESAPGDTRFRVRLPITPANTEHIHD